MTGPTKQPTKHRLLHAGGELALMLAFTLVWELLHKPVEAILEHVEHIDYLEGAGREWLGFLALPVLLGRLLHNYAHEGTHKIMHRFWHACAARLSTRALSRRKDTKAVLLILLFLGGVGARAQTFHEAKPPDSPFHSKPYWTAVTAGAAASYVDAWSTEKLFSVRPQAYEGTSPWLYGRRPSPARMYATVTAETFAIAGLTYILKRKHIRYWFAPEAFSAGSHVFGTANNVRLIRKDHGF